MNPDTDHDILLNPNLDLGLAESGFIPDAESAFAEFVSNMYPNPDPD